MGGFEVMDPGYRVLFDRAQHVLGSDPRVVKAQAGGSLATETADQWSDLDLQVVVADDALSHFLTEWESWLGSITPTVFARRPIAPFIINSLTPEGLTLDVAVYPASTGAPPPPPPSFAVGLLARQSFTDHRDAVAYAVEEQLRGMAGPFITYLKRDAHLLHLTGMAHVTSLLIEILLAENDVPSPPGKHLDLVLTDEQRAMLSALPPVNPTYDRLLEFGLAIAREISTRGRRLYDRFGLVWPAGLAEAAAGRVRDHLGVDVSGWL